VTTQSAPIHNPERKRVLGLLSAGPWVDGLAGFISVTLI
jgi:hypothetical protein